MKENRECYVSIGEINALPWLHTIWENGEVKWRGEATKKTVDIFLAFCLLKKEEEKRVEIIHNIRSKQLSFSCWVSREICFCFNSWFKDEIENLINRIMENKKGSGKWRREKLQRKWGRIWMSFSCRKQMVEFLGLKMK